MPPLRLTSLAENERVAFQAAPHRASDIPTPQGHANPFAEASAQLAGHAPYFASTWAASTPDSISADAPLARNCVDARSTHERTRRRRAGETSSRETRASRGDSVGIGSRERGRRSGRFARGLCHANGLSASHDFALGAIDYPCRHTPTQQCAATWSLLRFHAHAIRPEL